MDRKQSLELPVCHSCVVQRLVLCAQSRSTRDPSECASLLVQAKRIDKTSECTVCNEHGAKGSALSMSCHVHVHVHIVVDASGTCIVHSIPFHSMPSQRGNGPIGRTRMRERVRSIMSHTLFLHFIFQSPLFPLIACPPQRCPHLIFFYSFVVYIIYSID